MFGFPGACTAPTVQVLICDLQQFDVEELLDRQFEHPLELLVQQLLDVPALQVEQKTVVVSYTTFVMDVPL